MTEQTELLVDAGAWQGLPKSEAEEIATAEIEAKGQNREIVTAERVQDKDHGLSSVHQLGGTGPPAEALDSGSAWGAENGPPPAAPPFTAEGRAR